MPYAYAMKNRQKQKKGSLEKKIIKYEITHVDSIVLAVIGIIGVALFFKGLYILMENIIIDPVVAVVLGVILMFCSGYLIKGGKLWKTQ